PRGNRDLLLRGRRPSGRRDDREPPLPADQPNDPHGIAGFALERRRRAPRSNSDRDRAIGRRGRQPAVGCATARGNEIVNADPWPSPALSIRTEPPIIST